MNKNNQTPGDNLLQQIVNISKASAYDILADHVGELKEVIKLLIEVGELEDIKFVDEKDTAEFQAIVKKAKILSL